MSKTFSLQVVGNDDTQPFESGAPAKSLTQFSNYLRSCLGGARNGDVTMTARNDAVAASGTVTLATCLTGTVIEVNGVPFTAITSGTPVASQGEFVISGTDAADATSLAAAINASTDTAIDGVVTASSTGASGVVTVTADHKGYTGNGVTIETKGVVAKAIVTPTSVNANDTVTINGTAITFKQQRATGTLTAASAAAGDTFSIKGHTFTGQASAATPGTLTFDTRTSDTACGNSIVAQINSYAGLSGIVTASNSAGVVTVRAVNAGTAGNSITLTGTAVRLAASAATLTGGIAVANNECEKVGNDIQVAADFVRALNASTTAGLNTFVRGLCNTSATIVASNVDAGDAFTIHVGGTPYTFTGAAGAAAAGGATFSIDTGDNETAASIATQINARSGLSSLVSASASTATVTLRCLTAAAMQTFSITSTDGTDLAVTTAAKGAVTVLSKIPGTAGNAITIATADGTRLPITSSLSRLGGGTIANWEGAQASAIVTCASVANGDTVTINGVVFTAHTNTDGADQFAIDGNDTTDGDKLVRAINNSTSAGAKEVIASNNAGAVTITARRGGIQGNAITIATSDGTRLAITGSLARLAGGAAPTTVVMSGDRLASGSETSMSFSF